ncbi:MAG: hypothetical protein M3Q75_07325, partial [Gemmatimonadota bacterium]|nr:hypothetical protein [Gemmatimonadota bacterium]
GMVRSQERHLPVRKTARGGAAFTPVEREKVMNGVARLLLQGRKVQEIGDIYGVSRETIRAYSKILEERWRSSALVDIGEARMRELAKLDHLESMYWEGWERSLRNKKSHTQQSFHNQRKKGVEEGTSPEDVGMLTDYDEERDGDPMMLAGVAKCIEKRCRIYGLDSDKLTIFAEVKHGVADDLTIRLQKYAGILELGASGSASADVDRVGLGEPVDSGGSAPAAGEIFDTTGRVR